MREQARRDVVAETQEQDLGGTAEPELRERYAGGQIPPVQTGFAEPGATASQLAYEEDGNVRELKQKVGALVDRKFGGDMKKAFAHYDANHDGGISKDELTDLLSDAGVGNGFTRGVWASKIIERLDGGGDHKIQWSEFESVFRATA